MFSKFSLKGKLILSGIISLCLMASIGIISNIGFSQFVSSNKRVAHTYQVINSANSILESAINMETGMRGFLLTGQDEFLEPYNSGQKKFSKLIVSLRKTINENPEQLKLLGEIELTIKEWLEKVAEPIIRLRKKNTGVQTISRVTKIVKEARGKKFFDKFRIQISTFIERENELIKSRENKVTTNVNVIRFVILGVVIFGALIIWFITVFSLKPLNDATNEIRISSEELKTAAQEQLNTATEQVISTTQISTNMTELATTAKLITDTAKGVVAAADAAFITAGEGKKSLNNAVEGMEDIKAQVDKIVRHMLALGEKSQQMSIALDVINNLSEQTTILSYNASIEAAGAGESGRRFSAIAEQIMKLANKAVDSTKDIKTMIEDVQKSSNQTVMATEDGIKAVDEGRNRIIASSKHFDEIYSSSEIALISAKEIDMSISHQTIGIEEGSDGIKNIQISSEEVKVNSNQVLKTSEQMLEMANQLIKV